MNRYKSLAWYFFCKYFLKFLSDRIFVKVALFIHSLRFNFKYKLDLKNPKLFHEKITFLKLFFRKPEHLILADKSKVRAFVEDKIGKSFLVNSIGEYDDPNKINFELLPNQFVIKTTHGSGWNIIVRDKKKIDIGRIKSTLNTWLKMDPYYLSREWHYSKEPKLIIENYIGESINDYKLYCFEGKVRFIQVDSDRFSEHKRCFFDKKWNIQEFNILYGKPEKKVKKPKMLNKMIELSEKLAEDIFFCRVDMYFYDDKIFFGEITFHPEGGNCVISPPSMDYRLSDYIDLGKIKSSL